MLPAKRLTARGAEAIRGTACCARRSVQPHLASPPHHAPSQIDYTEPGQGTGNKIKSNDLHCAKASDYAVTIDPRIKGSNSVCSNSAKDCLKGTSNVCH